MTNEKNDTSIERLEHGNDVTHHDSLQAQGFAAESHDMPPGYFTSFYFIGSFTATGMNLMASTAGFALVAPVIGQINAAIGPSPSIIWLSLVYTTCLAVGLLLVGRLSDIFGRRYFFIVGTFLGLLGAIIAATANTVPVLIGGQTLIGLSACTGYSYAFLVGELVPVKYRFLANAVIFIFSLPTAGFGAAISTAFILYTGPGWRWVYYLLIILNGLTCVMYAIFYFPPTFAEKHGKGQKMEWIKNFDYVGLVLFCAGLVLFILGLSSGGSLYPWKSAHTISFIVVGILCLIGLFFWESFGNPKEPLIPMHLFKDTGYVAAMISLALGASVYYSQAIIWPQMTANVYAQGRPMWAGWVSSLVGIGVTVGEMIGGSFAKMIGKTKFQCLFVITIATLLLGVMAVCDINTPQTAIALVFIATIFVGWNEAIVLPICSMRIRDQQEIGTAVGVAGSARSAISTVASTIYSVVLTSRVTSTLTSQIPPALISAGLPASSVEGYMTAIAAGGSSSALAAIPGLTTTVEKAGTLAYRIAYMDAYRTIFYVSIAFGGLAILVSFWIPNVEEHMTGNVAATLHGGSAAAQAAQVAQNRKVDGGVIEDN